MTKIDPSNQRLDAIFRIVLLLVYTVTIWPIVLAIGLIGGLVFMITDVIVQLWKGNSGIQTYGNSAVTGWAERLFFWPIEQLKYIIGTDTSGFPVLP